MCRIAFVLEGISFTANCLTQYRPLSVEAAVAAINITEVVSQAEKMIVGYIHTGLWLFIWGGFSAWFGTTALQVGRRRLIGEVGQPASVANSRSRETAVMGARHVGQVVLP